MSTIVAFVECCKESLGVILSSALDSADLVTGKRKLRQPRLQSFRSNMDCRTGFWNPGQSQCINSEKLEGQGKSGRIRELHIGHVINELDKGGGGILISSRHLYKYIRLKEGHCSIARPRLLNANNRRIFTP